MEQGGKITIAISAILLLILILLILSSFAKKRFKDFYQEKARPRFSRIKYNLWGKYINTTNRSCTRNVETPLPQYNPRTQTAEHDGYEQYGELYICPPQRPVAVALDIIMRASLAHGIPSGGSVHYLTPPRLEVNLPQRNTLTAEQQVNLLMGLGNSVVGCRGGQGLDELMHDDPYSEANLIKGRQFLDIISSAARANTHDGQSKKKPPKIEESAERIRKGEWVDVIIDDGGRHREDDVATEPVSFSFGSDKNLARMYK